MEQFEKINAVSMMQEYILDHLHEPITLYQLAKVANYSPFYSAKIFKELIGKPPFEYIRNLRLSRAALVLQKEEKKVNDVAFDFVFDSHEGFTRAFSKQFGISPKQYQKHSPPIHLFLPYRIKDYYSMLAKGEKIMSEEKKTNTVFVQVLERPARKLILKRGKQATHYFEYCEEVGCDVWGTLSSIKEALYEPMGLWLPTHLVKPNTSIYVQGVEVPIDYQGIVPSGFELIELKPCSMMVFQGQPYKDEDFTDAIDELWEVIDNYNPKFYGFEWAQEDGPRFQLEPQGYRGYIEGRPVKPIK